MTDQSPPLPKLDVLQNGEDRPAASLEAVTTLIHAFASMMTSMEARLTDRITENAAASKERWGKWEKEFREYRDANDTRIGVLEGKVDKHLDEDERSDLVWNARLGPARRAATLISHNWKTVVVLLFAAFGALGLASDLLIDLRQLVGLP